MTRVAAMEVNVQFVAQLIICTNISVTTPVQPEHIPAEQTVRIVSVIVRLVLMEPHAHYATPVIIFISRIVIAVVQ